MSRPRIFRFALGAITGLAIFCAGFVSVPASGKPYRNRPAVAADFSGRTGPLLREQSGAPPTSGASAGVDLAAGAGGLSDLPARRPAQEQRADTISFGYYDGGTGFAVPGEAWTFDHGAPDPLEGWYAVDMTKGEELPFFHQITAASWEGHGNLVEAPIINGPGSLWAGRYEDEADSLCWVGGLGYGNRWCQRLISPTLEYGGQGGVSLSLLYFNESEESFDYSKVVLEVEGGDPLVLNGTGFSSYIGWPPDGPWGSYQRVISNADFGGGALPRPFHIVFEFTSDGGWSDEDGDWTTTYGPFGADDVSLRNNLSGGDVVYSFDNDLEGWTISHCSGVGSYFGVAPLSDYSILDPCRCGLSGNVAKLHNEDLLHGHDYWEIAVSPPIDRGSLGLYYNKILAEGDVYHEGSEHSAVYGGFSWSYYPYICPYTGRTMWSPLAGQQWWSTPEGGLCTKWCTVATDLGVPRDCQYVRFVYQVITDWWWMFPPPPEDTFTPLLDNIRIRVTHEPAAPVINFGEGCQFQDAFGRGADLSPLDPGNADVAMARPLPGGGVRPGDSLSVTGPIPTASTRYLARLWFRIRREGSRQEAIPGYPSWKNRVSDGLNIVGPQGRFASAWMDSSEIYGTAQRQVFCSQFHEMDDDFVSGQEQGEANEIIPDGVLAPGTQIEYFVTSNYTCTPQEMFCLPDTSGGYSLEFEILPSYRKVGGIDKFPCFLYVDACNAGAQYPIEHGLNVILNGSAPADPLPNPAPWDRYDYLFSDSDLSGPLARSPGGTGGATLAHLLPYRVILANTGASGAGNMDPADFQLFEDWLSSDAGGGDPPRRGFIGDGDGFGAAAAEAAPEFLGGFMGAALTCDAYHTPGCGPTPADSSYCVWIEDAAGAAYPSDNTAGGGADYAYNAWGNGCPQAYSFDVLAASGDGTGNRVYHDQDGGAQSVTEFAQVVHSQAGSGSGDYRTVLNGVSAHHLALREPEPGCAADTARIVGAVENELRAALNWIFDSSIPDICTGGLADMADPEPAAFGVRISLESRPNPAGKSATLRFTLAKSGPVELAVYDAAGRRVRGLLTGALPTGPHEVTWDGRDDSGHRLPNGVYWCRLRAGDGVVDRSMILLE